MQVEFSESNFLIEINALIHNERHRYAEWDIFQDLKIISIGCKDAMVYKDDIMNMHLVKNEMPVSKILVVNVAFPGIYYSLLLFLSN